MFDVGGAELLIIALVAVIVLGPERLPKAARFAGLWVRRARAQWYSVKSELERELAQEDLKRQFAEPLSQLRPQVEQLGQDLTSEFDGLDPGLPARVDLRAQPEEAAPAPVPEASPDPASQEAPAVAVDSSDDIAADSSAPSDPAPDEPRTGDLFGPRP
jgi:sec-independent protein translocase protein TatB